MVTAIILSGGKGKRMGAGISKQYIDINGKPILYYTLNAFIRSPLIDKVILVIPEDEKEYCEKEILNKYSLNVDEIVCGGAERQHSVYNGLKAAVDSEYVLIHDGARPFVTKRILEDGLRLVKEYKSVAPGVMPKDTIKIKNLNGYSESTLQREMLVAVQTPQIFDYKLIMECHEEIYRRSIAVTDDTMVVEKCGYKVYLYQGDYTNIKVTTPEDLVLAEYLSTKM